jgi:hypothetical protein
LRIKYAALRDKKVRKLFFQCLKSAFDPIVGTGIYMERFSDSLSKPLFSWTARPITTELMVGRRLPRRPQLPRGSSCKCWPPIMCGWPPGTCVGPC